MNRPPYEMIAVIVENGKDEWGPMLARCWFLAQVFSISYGLDEGQLWAKDLTHVQTLEFYHMTWRMTFPRERTTELIRQIMEEFREKYRSASARINFTSRHRPYAGPAPPPAGVTLSSSMFQHATIPPSPLADEYSRNPPPDGFPDFPIDALLYIMVIGDAHEEFGGNDLTKPQNVFEKLARFISHEFHHEVNPTPVHVEYAYQDLHPHIRGELEKFCNGTTGQGWWHDISHLPAAKRDVKGRFNETYQTI